jgi:oxygen-dependent protoporphyrinogen oxidase
MTTRVAVVGGGITGLSAALALLREDGFAVTVYEAQDRVGGKIRTSPFGGLPAVDEGADAFLARVPEGTALAREVGLGDTLTSPATGSAAIWWDGLQRIPDGLVLGMPSGAWSLARSKLLSAGGKLRAATEPLRPRTADADDSLGAYVRSRFGNQVLERLVDPLIGSIYATDTDRFSLDAVPQIAELAAASRSVVLGSRHRPPAAPGPVFFTPNGGVGALVDATADAVVAAGGEIRTGAPCTTLEADGSGWRLDGIRADAIVLACPAAQAARLLAQIGSDAAKPLSSIEYADVVLVTLAVPADAWPDRLLGLSGYLVPKPVQQLVTAVSFASQKWAHWRRDGQVLLRVSLGRDALPVLHLDDERLVEAAVTEVGEHLGIDLEPVDVRVTRWQRGFPQYRPHHHDLVGAVEQTMPASIVLAGASYHGIGIPACIRSGRAAARATADRVAEVRE